MRSKITSTDLCEKSNENTYIHVIRSDGPPPYTSYTLRKSFLLLNDLTERSIEFTQDEMRIVMALLKELMEGKE